MSSLKAIPFQLKDNKIKVITKDPHQNKDLSKLINRIVEPNNPQLYEPLSDKEGDSPTGVSIHFEYLFGFKSEKSRQSLFYLHQYQSPCKAVELGEMKNDRVRQASQN